VTRAGKDDNESEKRGIYIGQNLNVINYSLKKIAKGTIIVLMGSVIAILFNFIARVLLVRIFTQAEYGIFSLGFVLCNIFVTLSLLGLGTGTTRQIAYYRGKNNFLEVKRVLISAIQINVIASIILSITLFLTSDILSTKIFNDPALAAPLKVFAIAIPFFAFINILISIFRGFEQIKEKVYFRDILRNILFPLLLLPILFLGLPFIHAIYAFTASFIITFIVFILYSKKHFPISLKKSVKNLAINQTTKNLLVFSLPLLGVAALQMIVSWTDTLMLGGFAPLDEVGLYNAAAPLARFIGIPMAAMLLIYAPIVSGLYAKNLLSEISKNYAVLTKWIFSATFPLFFILFLFPEVVLNSLFGSDYIPASQALQILSLGFILANLLGPNGTTLVAIGRTPFIMWAVVAAAGTNIILNWILIPQLGIVGASIATAISLVLHCVIRHVKVHTLLKVNPITKNLLKTVIISAFLILLISFLTKSYLDIVSWMLPLLLILFYVIYFLVMLFSRSFDQEDITMLLEIENKTGLNFIKVKRLIKKFL